LKSGAGLPIVAANEEQVRKIESRNILSMKPPESSILREQKKIGQREVN